MARKSKTLDSESEKTLKRQTWRERLVKNSQKDPLVCLRCECYYEYKGEVCLEEGKLKIKVALGKTAKAYLERMIDHLTGVQKTKSREEEKKRSEPKPEQTKIYDQLCMFDMLYERRNTA